MFNTLVSIYRLFLLSLFSFFILFTIRHFCIKRTASIFLYHASFLIYLFFIIVGGSVQNDAYKRLKKFISLEENNELEDAKKNLPLYNSMFQIDLQQFKNSTEFKDYLTEHDTRLDQAEAISVGWFFVFLSEISLLLITVLSKIF